MATIVYNPSKLPFWQDVSIQAGPPKHSNTLTTTDKGYDILATRISPTRRAAAFRRSNANICDGHFQYPIFVTDFTLDIGLAGSTAQSPETRDFYPRNFVQPNFQITGQSLDQEHYGMMCDFIRHIQQEAIQTQLTQGGLVQFTLNGWGIEPGRGGGPGVTVKSKILGNFTRYNQMMKGQHQTILVLGYFNSMPREHQKGMYSPVWSCEFIVADMVEGPFTEDMVQATKQKTWVDLLTSTSNLSNSPQLIKETKANYQWALDHAANIINPGQAPPSGSSGGSSPSGVTVQSWAWSLLLALSAPTSDQNLKIMMGWKEAESGNNWPPPNQFNPLNTKGTAPGSHPSSNGITNFANWQSGIQTQATGLKQPIYAHNIYPMLQSGHASSSAAASAIDGSAFGTTDLSANLIDSVTLNPSGGPGGTVVS